MEFLGGKQRESLFEVEPHLMSEDTFGARTRTVGFLHTFTDYFV